MSHSSSRWGNAARKTSEFASQPGFIRDDTLVIQQKFLSGSGVG